MTQEEFLVLLQSYPLEQLLAFRQRLELHIKNRPQPLVKAPPRSQTDIQRMADNMGLDLSSLMREIAKR